MNKKLIVSVSILPIAFVLTTTLSAHAASKPVTVKTPSIGVSTTTSMPMMPSMTTTATATTTHTSIDTTLPVTASGQLSATAVSSDTDLNTYTSAALASDTAANNSASLSDNATIKDVTYQDNGVTANFTQPVKFLGLFPTSITAQAVVQADGKVQITYPWYSFLVRKHAAAISAIFQTQVTEATIGKAGISTDASATLSPQVKASILDALRHAVHGLRSKAAVSAAASTSTSATTQ